MLRRQFCCRTANNTVRSIWSLWTERQYLTDLFCAGSRDVPGICSCVFLRPVLGLVVPCLLNGLRRPSLTHGHWECTLRCMEVKQSLKKSFHTVIFRSSTHA